VAPNTEILIGDAGAHHVLIRPISRSHPGLFDYWDGNWIDCEVEIAAGGFRGHFRAHMRSEEFAGFLTDVLVLERTLEGGATFTTMEGQLSVTLSGDGKGHVHVKGTSADEPGSGNRLEFGFDIDQTYLQQIARGLESFVGAFPVVNPTEAS
jgi:hypothetical protein